jgi:protein-L-isoaspartate O-methyltransferase
VKKQAPPEEKPSKPRAVRQANCATLCHRHRASRSRRDDGNRPEDATLAIPEPYVLGGTRSETQRLITQARELQPHAHSLLETIPLEPGARAVDIGCGPIGVMDVLSERVGPRGLVVGLERERLFVEMAHAELSRRGLANVQVLNGDATRTGLEKDSYDLVHERLVLINLPAATRAAILAEMLSLLKPGGIIALQEYDATIYGCYPEHPSWRLLLELFNDSFHAAGGDEFIGRSLASLLRSAGAEQVEIKAHARFPKVGDYQRTHLLSLVKSMRDRILSSRRIGAVELNRHMGALADHLADPATTVIDKLLVQAWGRKCR